MVGDGTTIDSGRKGTNAMLCLSGLWVGGPTEVGWLVGSMELSSFHSMHYDIGWVVGACIWRFGARRALSRARRRLVGFGRGRGGARARTSWIRGLGGEEASKLASCATLGPGRVPMVSPGPTTHELC